MFFCIHHPGPPFGGKRIELLRKYFKYFKQLILLSMSLNYGWGSWIRTSEAIKSALVGVKVRCLTNLAIPQYIFLFYLLFLKKEWLRRWESNPLLSAYEAVNLPFVLSAIYTRRFYNILFAFFLQNFLLIS